MQNQIARRHFLKRTALASAALTAFPAIGTRGAESANNRLRVGVMGLGRGADHVNAFLQIPEVEVVYLCDIDDQRFAKSGAYFEKKGLKPPKTVKDLRHILDDKSIDAISIAAPNHWHAPATILGCQAGKHVYVEKPGSHNAREGELMVEAARKHQRVVQMGNQRRSWPGVIEAIEKLRSGAIGKVLSARCWYNNARDSIGRGKEVPVPAHIDYSLWQGPAPERPYLDNVVHYNWHWRWHWGGGELANNGIHALDVARWGLGVEYPRRVTFNGGRYHYQDDQETPDTGAAVYDFGDKGATWDTSSCHPRSEEKLSFVVFYGEHGSLHQVGGGYKIYDSKGKLTSEQNGPGGDVVHFQNFVDAIRSSKKLNSEIAEGQKSTLLCHLGNIAYRIGHTLDIDPASGKILRDRDAGRLWGREYRKGWELKV
ncbi:MAG: Gfo/Idh/MocA family oxidoreductase [Verrucomicrobiota bacterium]